MADAGSDVLEDLVRQTVRGVMSDADGATPVMARLRALGWDDLVAENERSAVSALFEEQGRALSTSSALDGVIVGAANVRDASTAGLPSPGGDRVVLPIAPSSAWPTSRLQGTTLVVDGLLLAADDALENSDRIVVPAAWQEGVAFVSLSTPAGLNICRVDGIDPSLAIARASGEVEADDVDDADGARRWHEAMLAARRALAHELIGATQVMLDLATEHARTRVQFGAPIGVHQAIKFPLADVFVALSAARYLLDEAWRHPSGDASGLAKAAAADAGLAAIQNCHQAMGAMGFTWEFPMHHYSRRVYAIDALLGDATALDRGRGARMLNAGAAPRIGDL